MTNRTRYKEALGQLDKDTRVCIKYLEGLIDEKFKLALKVKQPPTPPTPKVDFSKIEATLDSLQKQIDGLKKKADAAQSLVQSHDKDEKFLKNLVKKADVVLGEVRSLFDELYASGFFKEGQRRRLRDAGLIKRERGT